MHLNLLMQFGELATDADKPVWDFSCERFKGFSNPMRRFIKNYGPSFLRDSLKKSLTTFFMWSEPQKNKSVHWKSTDARGCCKRCRTGNGHYGTFFCSDQCY